MGRMRGSPVRRLGAAAAVLIVLLLLFPTREASRPVRETLFSSRQAPLSVFDRLGKGLPQRDVRPLWLGVGSAAQPGGEKLHPAAVVNGCAFLLAAGQGKNAETTFLIDADQGAGLAGVHPPAGVFRLPDGPPVPLDYLRRWAGSRLPGAVLLFGAVELDGVKGKERGLLCAFFAGDKQGLDGWPFWTAGTVGRAVWLEAPADPAAGLSISEMMKAVQGRKPLMMELHPETRLRAAHVYTWTSPVLQPYTSKMAFPLADLARLDPSIVLDIRYATTNNFTGRKIYPEARAYLARDVAERLVLVNKALRRKGFRLKVYDAYRPVSAHWRLWEAARDKSFLADPGIGSKHSRAAAVDCTLVTLNGGEVEMPTAFDDFSFNACRSSPTTPKARRNLDVLTRAMTEQGFLPLEKEWWHFDAADWARYPLLDIPLG